MRGNERNKKIGEVDAGKSTFRSLLSLSLLRRFLATGGNEIFQRYNELVIATSDISYGAHAREFTATINDRLSFGSTTRGGPRRRQQHPSAQLCCESSAVNMVQVIGEITLRAQSRERVFDSTADFINVNIDFPRVYSFSFSLFLFSSLSFSFLFLRKLAPFAAGLLLSLSLLNVRQSRAALPFRNWYLEFLCKTDTLLRELCRTTFSENLTRPAISVL